MHPALYSVAAPGGQVLCRLCPHDCVIAPGRSGLCGVRQNREGVLYSLNYGKAIALHVDPIEKKPLYHVYPGSRCFSIAAAGCNFRCRFCQNHEISQIRPGQDVWGGREVTARLVIEQAVAGGCRTLACTYTEPTVYYEYALEICRLAHAQGIDTIWVTNGFIHEPPLREIAPCLTAANVDLKGWNEDFYHSVVGGALAPVLDTLRLLKKLGIWLEVTTLAVPGYSDDEESLHAIALFIKDELGPETPWHISRFYPQYRMIDLPPTPLEVLHKARRIGLEAGLRYVYTGNAPGDIGENTYCYRCGVLLIERSGYTISANYLESGCCPQCRTKLDGLFSKEAV
ncbi:MAG TPA: AmmeMemoRadiSam system radical SAM enzyme [bacterium]|nr:AmmeMemoRadiSam system radical SAM enzyme [bacterium]HQI49680.1 AmmeMemoRadiSam system radical SAM enzyme [bacterium]HQJ64531.1 AmmeMemoRadiSam system radical SAM enzyme [bacterium]